jgi:cell pole-organizing protein PopZ
MADARSEPSMEDILASIKRIIADDTPLPRLRSEPPVPTPAPVRAAPIAPPVAAAPIAPPPPPSDESILELTDRIVQPAPMAVPQPPAAAPQPSPIARAAEHIRRSEAASLQARKAAPDLASGGITLEALAREMMEPMIERWLEANLPAITERLVREEIARIRSEEG